MWLLSRHLLSYDEEEDDEEEKDYDNDGDGERDVSKLASRLPRDGGQDHTKRGV